MMSVQAVGDIIRWILSKMYPTLFRSIPKFKIYTPITKDDLEKFDKKFTRKMIRVPDTKTKSKESDSSFCDRIIKEAINEKMKKVIK